MITNAKDFYVTRFRQRGSVLRHRRQQSAVDFHFSKKGAIVLACDKRNGKIRGNRDQLERQGVELHLGKAIREPKRGCDFPYPGMPYYRPS